jgi:hypothetical protein
MKISAMPQSLAPGLSNGGKEYFRRGLRAMQGQCRQGCPSLARNGPTGPV